MNIVSPKMDLQSIDFREGAMLLVNKPKDWTSFDVVNKIRFALKRFHEVKKIKVGHAGTLDPMATGLLIICAGKMTKKIHHFQEMNKSYEGTMTFGAVTPSYDAETDIQEIFETDQLRETEIIQKSREFTGWIDQMPPMYSAIKVKGQPLYRLARKGQTVERKTRKVQIIRFDLHNFKLPEVDFFVECSKGTYIRSLVHDLGQSLQNGAYLSRLERTEIGPYQLDQAWDLLELVDQLDQKA